MLRSHQRREKRQKDTQTSYLSIFSLLKAKFRWNHLRLQLPEWARYLGWGVQLLCVQGSKMLVRRTSSPGEGPQQSLLTSYRAVVSGDQGAHGRPGEQCQGYDCSRLGVTGLWYRWRHRDVSLLASPWYKHLDLIVNCWCPSICSSSRSSVHMKGVEVGWSSRTFPVLLLSQRWAFCWGTTHYNPAFLRTDLEQGWRRLRQRPPVSGSNSIWFDVYCLSSNCYGSAKLNEQGAITQRGYAILKIRGFWTKVQPWEHSRHVTGDVVISSNNTVIIFTLV